MRQQRIKLLLDEAMKLSQDVKEVRSPKVRNTIGARICEIQAELKNDLYKHRDAETNLIVQGILDQVYVDTVDHCPEKLPGLLPFFTALCGERVNGMWIASVDWPEILAAA